MTFTIRRATPADIGDISKVHIASWKTTYQGIVPQEYLDALDVAARAQRWEEEFARGDSHIFVAQDAGTICGFISGGPLREPIGNCDVEIYAIYVLADAQRYGIGRTLMRALAMVFAEGGFAHPAVWVLAENPSRHFYAHLGAKPIMEKQIQIGGADLMEIAYGWESLGDLVRTNTGHNPQ
jgi:ribosomal protein S18 acetylase RimI-like enzyme